MPTIKPVTVKLLPNPPGPSVYAGSTDNEVPAVWGTSLAPGSVGPLQQGGSGTGVYGSSGSGIAVQGFSDGGIGVQGVSNNSDAVQGTSSSSQHAGVSGVNNNGGFAFWGASDSDNGTGIFARGKRQAAQFVQTDSGSDEDGVVSTAATTKHAAVSATNTGGGFAFWGASDNDNGTGIFARGKRQAAQFLQTDSGSDEDGVVSTAATTKHAAVSATNTGGGFAFWGASDSTNGTGIYARGKKQAAQFDGAVQVNGTLTATVDIVLGSDCAEDFDVASATEVEPGTVMVLTGHGALEPSETAYDKKVAGVISGAGEFKPGLILGRDDSSQSRMPLALVGKVYCKVDAQYGPVEVGDLLTTSPTAGHAMRAAEPSKAFGAVIGRALRSLESGQALIPILIALQ